MGSPPQTSPANPTEGEARPSEHRSRADGDALLRRQARALRPWAWAVLLACTLAIVLVCNILLLGLAAKATRALQAPGISGFCSVVVLVVLWGLWIAAGVALLAAVRRWLRGALGPVWRRALRRTPRAAAAGMAAAAGVMTWLIGGAWNTDPAWLVFMSLTWAVIVAASARPPRL